MRLVHVFAVLAVVAAAGCETAPPPSAEAIGSGGAGGAGGGYGESGGRGLAGTSTSSLAAAQQEIVAIGDRVFFGLDKFALEPEGRSLVERQAAFLSRNPGINVVIEGHCDERGTREYNLALAERRANSVKEYMVALGIDPGRISTISYGEERPDAIGSSEQAWAKNRRGVTVVAGTRPEV